MGETRRPIRSRTSPWRTKSDSTMAIREVPTHEKKEPRERFFSTLKKRGLKKGKLILKEVHKRVVSPPLR